MHISCTETNTVSKHTKASLHMTHVIQGVLSGLSRLISKHLDAPDELLDDVCHMESHFGPFGDSVRFDARLVHGLRLMHHRLRNHYGST